MLHILLCIILAIQNIKFPYIWQCTITTKSIYNLLALHPCLLRQVANTVVSGECGATVQLPGPTESEGWWFKSPPVQYFYHEWFFITPRSCMVFCKTFYYQEMACVYPPNAPYSECQIFYFLTFSAKRSKFLERTLNPYPTALSSKTRRRYLNCQTLCFWATLAQFYYSCGSFSFLTIWHTCVTNFTAA